MRLIGLALLLVIGGASTAWAQQRTNDTWQDSQKTWLAEDDCVRKAHKRYPDYTRESNFERERAIRLCLATGNLPPRVELTPPPPPTASNGAAAKP